MTINYGQMKLYTSTGTKKSIQRLNELNVGLLMVNVYRNPDNWPYFAVDNGCYSAFNQKEDWNAGPFLNILNKLVKESRIPDWIVIPDKPTDPSSLDFSMAWLPILERMYPTFPKYLAVQDGMSFDSVDSIVDRIDGIFIGGSMDWKLDNMKGWVEYAHSHDIQCHVGRIGPIQRMILCELAGADSIDSTTWVQVRGGVDKYVNGFKTQTLLEVD